MNLRTGFFILLGLLLVWFLFIERAILSPFILAAIFAYILTPVVNFLSKKLHLSRTVGVIVIYGVIFAIFIVSGAILTQQIGKESLDISQDINVLLVNARHQIHTFPIWLQPLAKDLLASLQKARFLNYFNSGSSLPFYSQAVSRIIGFFIFLFSGFYFLRDGSGFIDKLFVLVPKKHKEDVEVLLRKINAVLGGYLRGQIFLIFLVSLMLYIALSIIGVKFALTIAIFSGFAEIVPVIGPVVAGSIATLVTLFSSNANFGLTSLNAALLVVVIYFVLRQLEDYFVIPHVMEKITKLQPFIIFFAVIAGGHIAGILGLILAVPTAAILRLLIEFALEKVNSVG